ncbi:shikimate kinase [Salinimicrobium soli]|uniref:shikimate kinase n=1 Tax=Salinimicrobium soli TaxID=1254399 RepID=UPI003AAD1AA9
MKIILSGYMGSGKTVVGKSLAEKIGVKYMDLDEEISKWEGKNIPDIFKESGEIYFRRKEGEVLQEILKNDNSVVLSLGGGTPCYGKNLQLIKDDEDSVLIYLKTDLQELLRRLSEEKDQRPVISHLGSFEALEDFVRKHLYERSFYYNQSEIILSTEGKSVEEVVNAISEKLK